MHQVTDSGKETADAVGVVVIGRNEGERLERCLKSLADQRIERLVYVDSGSTDGSVAFAKSIGFEVHELDLSKPFTMPRGRNEGFSRLIELYPGLHYVQFVDGDCEVETGWIARAAGALDEHSSVAAVSGRRRELFPEASIYNYLAEVEWDRPLGEVKSTGGDVMMRVEVFAEVGGFDPSLIAGEEAELFIRIRALGWKVLQLSDPMTKHDSAITRFSQWWKRSKRTGHAYAEGMAMHGFGPERHEVRPVLRFMFWAGVMPVMLLLGLVMSLVAGGYWWVLVVGLLLAHLLAYVRIVMAFRHRLGRRSWLYAYFLMLGKYPELLGGMTYLLNRLRGRRTGLIEYDRPVAVSRLGGEG
ncbi:glycosyltransferase [Mucisphaera sp.]|uniref:glycosyltransferase n=1 Tax=Mucisphaera sp. TaxID=2913024 RepID=UPI003D0FF301